ncbi:class I SAM-dependent methyltransferase [Paenibacillus cellulositrophicus]|uniref:class I SAM-dependent methyltransferase n=1 Tax=Paenibacillus cellulositrophicus TaxID=562959 RepID=UPI00203E305A|nr:class I SAM-dependent methyltransferase [Paenibacillus cellulositrophicus]MCM3000150.1 class I SAM-dependent methyltransferase [Paenibacillus cellulositrophicus]
MHRFWEKVIKPLIIATRPRTIVEIGSLRGQVTYKLLDYCKHVGARCIAIDPVPQMDTELVAEYYGSSFQMIRKLSLEALPAIKQYDMILIDGDHNWYTVFHELKLVEQMAARTGQFPVVILHDTEWPYGRRDMYYFPESIPQKFRKPFATRGIEPGRSELLPLGGFNHMVSNALYEHGDRNGVLTAVEDFIEGTSYDLRLYRLHSSNGLGIILEADSPAADVLPYILNTSGL